MAKLVRTRPAASEYYYSYARQVAFEDLKKPEAAQIVIRNQTEGVALRRINVVFDTVPDENYAPKSGDHARQKDDRGAGAGQRGPIPKLGSGDRFAERSQDRSRRGARVLLLELAARKGGAFGQRLC